MNLARRLDELEQRMGKRNEDAVSCIFLVALGGPGEKKACDDRICGFASGEKRWIREVGESTEALRARVVESVKGGELRGRTAIPLVAAMYPDKVAA